MTEEWRGGKEEIISRIPDEDKSSILYCRRCGALVLTSHSDQHKKWHIALGETIDVILAEIRRPDVWRIMKDEL